MHMGPQAALKRYECEDQSSCSANSSASPRQTDKVLSIPSSKFPRAHQL